MRVGPTVKNASSSVGPNNGSRGRLIGAVIPKHNYTLANFIIYSERPSLSSHCASA